MIRSYRESDADALWELKHAFELSLATDTGGDEKEDTYREKLDADYRQSYIDWVQRCVAETPRAVQLAERDGETVGYVFVLPVSLAHIWDAAVLNEIFVAEQYRGTDVGDDLMDAALALAREQDLPLDRIVLDVDPDNARAADFYDRWGFEPWGELVAHSL